MTASGVLTGISAALRVPLWLRGRRWTELLRPHAAAVPGAEPANGAVRAALLTLRLLGRAPASPWRNTCLYRSIAECLVLRAYGVDARVRIGVGTEASEVIAHAWVVRGDQPDAEVDPAAAALRPLGFRA
jgi:hypothetical protein